MMPVFLFFRIFTAVINCQDLKEDMKPTNQKYNFFFFCQQILPHFPRMTQIGMAIERRVDKLSKEEKDKRPDIYALAIA